ncbi:MAG: hypothetical protein WC403_10370 [Proteiniphilum sp.]|jgi:hypothetical protein
MKYKDKHTTSQLTIFAPIAAPIFAPVLAPNRKAPVLDIPVICTQ